jgi:hypothetical protein
MPAEAELVMFGIAAALRINSQFRHAYADSTRSRAITLPLPNFPAERNRETVENWYRNGPGQAFVVANNRVKLILNTLTDSGDLPPDLNEEFFGLYNEHFTALNAADQKFIDVKSNPAGLTNDHPPVAGRAGPQSHPAAAHGRNADQYCRGLFRGRARRAFHEHRARQGAAQLSGGV